MCPPLGLFHPELIWILGKTVNESPKKTPPAQHRGSHRNLRIALGC